MTTDIAVTGLSVEVPDAADQHAAIEGARHRAARLEHLDVAHRLGEREEQVGGGVDPQSLPGPDFLESKSGTKEGQVQMIRQPDGGVTAHQWSSCT